MMSPTREHKKDVPVQAGYTLTFQGVRMTLLGNWFPKLKWNGIDAQSEHGLGISQQSQEWFVGNQPPAPGWRKRNR